MGEKRRISVMVIFCGILYRVLKLRNFWMTKVFKSRNFPVDSNYRITKLCKRIYYRLFIIVVIVILSFIGNLIICSATYASFPRISYSMSRTFPIKYEI